MQRLHVIRNSSSSNSNGKCNTQIVIRVAYFPGHSPSRVNAIRVAAKGTATRQLMEPAESRGFNKLCKVKDSDSSQPSAVELITCMYVSPVLSGFSACQIPIICHELYRFSLARKTKVISAPRQGKRKII